MDKKTDKPGRPLCLELQEARADIFGVIKKVAEDRHLPWYLIEPIVSDAAKQVSENARQERQTAAAMYEKQLKEFEQDKDRSSGKDETDGCSIRTPSDGG